MNSAYFPIIVAIIQFVGTLLFFAWKKGQDDAKLEILRQANNELCDEVQDLKDNVAKIRGWLRGSQGAPINGGN